MASRIDSDLKFLLITIALAMALGLFLWWGVSNERRQFEEGSAFTNGVIVRMGFKNIRVAYWVGGERYVTVKGVDESERRRAGNVEIGDSVEVEYVLKNPGLARARFDASWRSLKYRKWGEVYPFASYMPQYPTLDWNSQPEIEAL